MALSLEEEEEDLHVYDAGASMAEKCSQQYRESSQPRMPKIVGLILTIPKKWQKEERMRGVSLFQEKFQFIFQYEHDMLDVLEK